MLELSRVSYVKENWKEIRAGEPSVYVLIHGGYWANTEKTLSQLLQGSEAGVFFY